MNAVVTGVRTSTQRTLACVMALAAYAGVTGCAAGGPAHASSVAAGATCTAPAVDGAGRAAAGETLRWLDFAQPADRTELDQWCRAVGPAVVSSVTHAAPEAVDSIPVIAWNIHLGAADVDALVTQLRSGSLTGAPVEHFVLLIQEALRTSEHVPAPMPADGRAARRLGRADAADITRTAARLGLNLFYVPSMRDGAGGATAADRGNAILSTLPLRQFTAIELPLLAQRRVVASATVTAPDRNGRQRELRLTSVHLDIGSDGRNVLALFGPGRTLQAGALSSALEPGGNDVVGGDFNTWSLPALERGLTRMQTDFPHLPEGAGEPTFYTAGILPRRLDHLFLRSVDVHGSAPVRLSSRYGSDHYPVMTWIRLAQ